MVSVQSPFPEGECSTDCKGVLGRWPRRHGKEFVNVVHGRDDGSQVGDATRKIKCRLFENLDKIVNTSKTNKSEGLLTFKTSRSSAAMSHSADTSSCLQRSNSQTAVIVSMATRYWTANRACQKLSSSKLQCPGASCKGGGHGGEVSCSMLEGEWLLSF